MKEYYYLIHKINGVEVLQDLQSLPTAQANALDIMAEISGKAAKLMLINAGFPQKHEIIITHAKDNSDGMSWGGLHDSSSYAPSTNEVFRFECRYE